MTETPAARHYSEQQAGSLTSGDQLLLPDGERTAEIQRVEVESDDFGTPAVVLANLTGGGTIRIAAGSTVKILAQQPRVSRSRTSGRGRAPNAAPHDVRRRDAAPTPGSRNTAPDAREQSPQRRRQPRRLPPSSYLPCLPPRPRRAAPPRKNSRGFRSRRARPKPWWRLPPKPTRTPWVCCCWRTSWPRASTSSPAAA